MRHINVQSYAKMMPYLSSKNLEKCLKVFYQRNIIIFNQISISSRQLVQSCNGGLIHQHQKCSYQTPKQKVSEISYILHFIQIHFVQIHFIQIHFAFYPNRLLHRLPSVWHFDSDHPITNGSGGEM